MELSAILRNDTTLYSSLLHCTYLYSAVQCTILQCSAVHYITMQCCSLHYNAVQFTILQCRAVQYKLHKTVFTNCHQLTVPANCPELKNASSAPPTCWRKHFGFFRIFLLLKHLCLLQIVIYWALVILVSGLAVLALFSGLMMMKQKYWCYYLHGSRDLVSPLWGIFFYNVHCTAHHCTALYCTALHCTALHCTALYSTALHCAIKCQKKETKVSEKEVSLYRCPHTSKESVSPV